MYRLSHSPHYCVHVPYPQENYLNKFVPDKFSLLDKIGFCWFVFEWRTWLKNLNISDSVNRTVVDVPKRKKQFVLFICIFIFYLCNKYIETANIESPVDYLRNWNYSLKKILVHQKGKTCFIYLFIFAD